MADQTPAQRERNEGLASLIMWALTGRRYGLCEITVQPCQPRSSRSYQVYPLETSFWGGGSWYPYIESGVWHNAGSGGCGSCCTARCQVDLPGPTTKTNILEVRVDGVVVPAGSYQVHDQHWLIRTDGQCWPSCVNFNQQDPPAFTVRYRRGETVPQAVLDATAVLVCELGKLCAGQACRLPPRVASLTRQGVQVQFADLTDLIAQRLTGIDEIDRVILAVNPGRLTSPPQIYTPDLPPPRMVT